MKIKLKTKEELDKEFEELKKIHGEFIYMFEVPLDKKTYFTEKVKSDIIDADGNVVETIEKEVSVRDVNKYGNFIMRDPNRQEYDAYINLYKVNSVAAMESLLKSILIGGDSRELIYNSTGQARNDWPFRCLELPVLNHIIMPEIAVLKKN